jgi:glycolate oxidase FAD binding subunit
MAGSSRQIVISATSGGTIKCNCSIAGFGDFRCIYPAFARPMPLAYSSVLSPKNSIVPGRAEDLASALAAAASARHTITLGGRFSKNKMAGPIGPSDVTISTTGLNRLLSYEPNDLTVSVEAGMKYSELSRVLAAKRQMVPLDPPFAEHSTVGGVVATNSSGPRRRLYGTARDLVIGMTFATLQGKLVKTGGMVVKNVAGLDMGKLMIGSFGTLAAIAVVNFKVLPMPEVDRLLLLSFDAIEQAIAARDQILKSVLQPAAVDLFNRHAAKIVGWHGCVLAVRAAGNAAVVDRYQKELGAMGSLEIGDASIVSCIQEFTPRFLSSHENGAVVRISCTLSQLGEVMRAVNAPILARAGTGVCYAYFDDVKTAAEVAGRTRNAIIDFASESQKPKLKLWPEPGPDFELMKRIKLMFDPERLLNRGRLYSQL